MSKKKEEIGLLKIRADSEKEQLALGIFNLIKHNNNSFDGNSIAAALGVPAELVSRYLDACSLKGLIEATDGSAGSVRVNVSKNKEILGIGFRGGNCFLSVMDLARVVKDREKIEIGSLLAAKGRIRDVSAIAGEITGRTKFKDASFGLVGLAVPEELVEMNPKTTGILSRKLSAFFGARVLAAGSAAASGYGDADFCPETYGKNVLYMFSDVGIGIILRDESILDAGECVSDPIRAYLRPWNQFGVVNIAKDLISRGVGTDVVDIVGGDVDKITMSVIFSAAAGKDVLAEDLVKRSALALGVRVAYIANMFDIDVVIFGGETEKSKSDFISCARASASKFLVRTTAAKIKMIPGVLGEESSSVGAAALCRRQIFMEV